MSLKPLLKILKKQITILDKLIEEEEARLQLLKSGKISDLSKLNKKLEALQNDLKELEEERIRTVTQQGFPRDITLSQLIDKETDSKLKEELTQLREELKFKKSKLETLSLQNAAIIEEHMKLTSQVLSNIAKANNLEVDYSDKVDKKSNQQSYLVDKYI